MVGTLFVLGSVWIGLPLTIRRIRDVGMSWKWIFLVSTPYIGGIFILIFLTRPSIIILDGEQYYLKSKTREKDIWFYWIGSFIVLIIVIWSVGLVFTGIALSGLSILSLRAANAARWITTS